jgi:hypothetical protein
VDVIHNSYRIGLLGILLDILLKWGDKPTYLIPMAYRWCSAISEEIRELRGDGLTPESLEHSRCLEYLLPRALATAFRHIGPHTTIPLVQLPHTHHHEWMLDKIFTSEDDDRIADAVCVWIVNLQVTPSGSCTRRLARLTERGRPFSPRLRWAIVLIIQQFWHREFEAAELEFVCLLNNLEGEMGEAGDGDSRSYWVDPLARVLRSPMGLERLSSYYWLLFGNLVSMGFLPNPDGDIHIHMETMKSLEEAQDWEKLETWMLVVWRSQYYLGSAPPIHDIERATLKLFLQRPSAIPRFEDLHENDIQSPLPPLLRSYRNRFRRICDQARAEQSRLEPPS